VDPAWVSVPSEEDLRRSFAERFPGMPHPLDFGFLPAMTRLVAAHPRIGAALDALAWQVMFAPGMLDRREREMVAAVASAAQDCFY
jgi:hypothetical protein